MHALLPKPLPRPVVYPDSDGMPMAESTFQYEWIVTIKGGLDASLPDFVAGDLLWYPVEGHPEIRVAPDVLVALGRPKGYRGSYRQWEEEGVAPQVVFEILSPGNRLSDMIKKFNFYEDYQVQEYYVYNPDTDQVFGWKRGRLKLEDILEMDGWVSPLWGIRFQKGPEKLLLFHADGRPFLTFAELSELARRAEAESQRAEAESQRAEAESQRAEAESQRAEAESQRAEAESQRAEVERQRADEATALAGRESARAALLEARLRALGLDPDAL